MPRDAGSELVTLTPAPAGGTSSSEYDFDASFDAELDAPVDDEPRIGRSANSPPPAAPAEPPKPAEPAKPFRHSRRLVREALEFGFSQEDIDNTPSEELDDRVYDLRREAAIIAQQQQREQWMERTRQQMPPSSPPGPDGMGVPPADATRPAAHGSAPAPDGEDFSFTANDGEYDAELVGGIKRVLKQQMAEIKTLKDQLGQLHAIEGRRQAETLTQTIDRAFASLGAAHEPFFGKGSAGEIDESAMARRKALLTHVETAMKGKPGTLAAKIAEAAKLLYPVAAGSAAERYGTEPAPAPAPAAPKPAAPVDDGLGDARQRWANAGLAHPTQRTSPEPKGPTRAMETAAAYMRENGLTDPEGDDKDGFLD